MDVSRKIRILIVDDHYFIRVGLTECIHMEPDLEVVGEGSNGQQAVELFRTLRPDVALIDLMLPGMSGVDAISAFRQESPDAKVIMISTYDGDEDVYRAFQAGAKGYLLKSMERDILVEAIRTVHSGKTYIPAVVAERLSQRLPRPELSPREMDVLRLIVKGLSNKEIASSLLIAEGTVKLHVHKVLEKLRVSDRTQAATAALQRGLIHLHV